MGNVKCNANTCVYNKHHSCFKRHINIVGVRAIKDEHTECINFTLGNSDIYANEMAAFEESKAETKISCTATKCEYFKKYICVKDKIMVSGKKATYTEDTCCESFKLID